MNSTPKTMTAVSCVLSVRPRQAGQVILAATRVQGQGTTVSIAARMGLRLVAFGAPFQGGVSVATVTFDPAYKTSDVVCSRSGRPPV